MPFQIIRGSIDRINAQRVVKADVQQGSVDYNKELRQAVSEGLLSIAFPAWEGMVGYAEVFKEIAERNEMDIFLVVPEGDNRRISGEDFWKVKSYLESRCQPKATFSEPKAKRTGLHCIFAVKTQRVEHCEEAQPVECLEEARPTAYDAAMASASLDDRLKNMYTDSFEKHLQQLINKKGMKNSQVYAAANISKQYFSKLMKGQVKPSKEKVLALAIGLQLNLDETIDFLRFAGYALSPVSQTDVVVEYFIEKKDYNVMKIDIVLFDLGLGLLSQ